MNILYTAFVLLLCVAGPLTLAWRRSLPFTSKKTKKSLAMVATEVKAERAQNWLDKFDYHKEDKLPWSKDGYKSWAWKGHKINYVDVGGDDLKSKKPPLLLIHGFGASSYHWRYNIPILARKYHVFAIDLLGFGLSDKPIIEYSADIWRDEVLDFISEIVHPLTNKQGCVVAGNSLGGFTALYASASSRATDENLITGCILLNAAGTFRSLESVDTKKEKNAIIEFIKAKFQRFIIGLSFIYTKQPARIAQVLKQVYSVDPTNVDDDLVASIQYPAQDPNAAEVFFRVISRNAAVPTKYVDELLSDLKLPLMLLWGMKDPWIRPITADRIQELKPDLVRVNLEAGHCPHDEVPNEVNEAILNFAQSIYK
jgi:pimeloyl-ACP methyl ester carboxylesterase